MKKLIVILVLALSMLFSCQNSEMQKYLNDTEAMAREGKYEEALERHLWFHDHVLEHQPSMAGVRLSFALAYWKGLADVYPPALEAMQKVRDDKTDLINQGKGSWNLFQDVAALNRTLGEDNRTVSLFQNLDKDQPDMAKECRIIAKEEVIKAREYDLAIKYIGNLVQDWGNIKSNYDRSILLIFSKSAREYSKKHFVEETLLLIDVALALDDKKAAQEIQAKALEVLDDNRLKEAITQT